MSVNNIIQGIVDDKNYLKKNYEPDEHIKPIIPPPPDWLKFKSETLIIKSRDVSEDFLWGDTNNNGILWGDTGSVGWLWSDNGFINEPSVVRVINNNDLFFDKNNELFDELKTINTTTLPLTGWSYRRQVIITNSTSTDLTNYAVRIVLDNSNFDFSKANSDGSDVRLTSSDGVTLLDYYIKEYDSTNERAIIWVKVPSINANSNVIVYLYYGNPTATSLSNANNVFDYFNDFNNNPNITTPSYSSGLNYNYFKYDTTNKRINYKAEREGSSGHYGGYPFWFQLQPNFSLSDWEWSFDWKVTNHNYSSYATSWFLGFTKDEPENARNGGGVDRIGVLAEIDTRYASPPAIKIYSKISSTDYSSGYIQSLPTNTVLTVKLKKTSDSLNLKVYNGDELLGEENLTVPNMFEDYNFVLYVSGGGGNTTPIFEEGWFDNFTIRKIVSSEPTVMVGEESTGAFDNYEFFVFKNNLPYYSQAIINWDDTFDSWLSTNDYVVKVFNGVDWVSVGKGEKIIFNNVLNEVKVRFVSNTNTQKNINYDWFLVQLIK